MNNGMSKLIAVIYLYLANTITARQFIGHIDKLVSDDQLFELPVECKEAFDTLHQKIALCVWDDQTYNDAPDIYIKEPEMKTEVENFISDWGKVLSEKL
jgi:hypothetical protein